MRDAETFANHEERKITKLLVPLRELRELRGGRRLSSRKSLISMIISDNSNLFLDRMNKLNRNTHSADARHLAHLVPGGDEPGQDPGRQFADLSLPTSGRKKARDSRLQFRA
jgi:hypothetical protein